MDKDTAKTLRTLGIVLTSILLISGSIVLLLASLCFGIIASSTHGSEAGQLSTIAVGAFVSAVVLIVIGVVLIAKLARGLAAEPRVVPGMSSPSSLLDPPVTASQSFTIDAAHFSPSSRAAVRNLVAAIAVLIAIDLLSTLVPVLRPSFLHPGLPVFQYAIIYRLLAVAPYAVLLYALLLRSPGPRTFAYALAVPGIPVAYGALSLPVWLIALETMKGIPFFAALLVFPPIAMDIVILYFAWTAIARTGIHPPPKRLIIASAVIFVYRLVFTTLSGFLFAMSSKLFRG